MEFLSTGFNLVLILLGFGVLIFVHELGHFLAAKWAGIRTEAFAVGMGQVVLSWRRGIGLVLGSTVRRVVAKTGREPAQLSDQELEEYRIGETEYSLRWLPFGGFVKMLGQDDLDPAAVSHHPRSYNMCPVGKRMVVVSAGVVMNLLLAVALFIIAFMAGVKFEAPVIGEVVDALPAGRTVADNAEALGITTVGLQPDDRVAEIDGDAVSTFADIQIASAMSKPDQPISLIVERRDKPEPLRFTLLPEEDPATGLLSIGVGPGTSTTLVRHDSDGFVSRALARSELTNAGITPGMKLVSVDGLEVNSFGQLVVAARQSGGRSLHTVWANVDPAGNTVRPWIESPLPTRPVYQLYLQRKTGGDIGLLGLAPLQRIARVYPDSPNVGVLRPGDIIIRIGSVDYPRLSQIHASLREHKARSISIGALRNGERHDFECKVTRKSRLMIELEFADDILLTAQPILTHARYHPTDVRQVEEVRTPITQANLIELGGTEILEVAGRVVHTWPEFREALRESVSAACASQRDADAQLTIAHPTLGHPREEFTVSLTAEEVQALCELAWTTDLDSYVFEPLYTVRTAGGSPIRAVAMGFEETKKLVLLTYLTIDRLIRGSVGIEQLHGPVGIVHIGAKIADRGFMYLIFFLAMISVNLAVINFLPLPVVDGGLFLFLIYEKLKGRPPSVAFQNAATVVGLFLIGTVFLVVTWNDVVRLLGS